MPRLARAAALFVAAAALAAQTTAQPTAVTPTYTAFPDLKTPTTPVDLRDGKTGRWPDYPALHARLRAAADRPLAPDAPPAARVRSHQLKAGVEYLLRMHAGRRGAGVCRESNELVALVGMVNDVYRAAAGVPGVERAGLVEERVRALKELERVTEAQVNAGADPPELLHFIRFHRLAAEGELLELAASKVTSRCPSGSGA
ncbi:hypothetical protein J0H58_33845 [bacterium]|nr:hypothetical protein [bacterium]